MDSQSKGVMDDGISQIAIQQALEITRLLQLLQAGRDIRLQLLTGGARRLKPIWIDSLVTGGDSAMISLSIPCWCRYSFRHIGQKQSNQIRPRLSFFKFSCMVSAVSTVRFFCKNRSNLLQKGITSTHTSPQANQVCQSTTDSCLPLSLKIAIGLAKIG